MQRTSSFSTLLLLILKDIRLERGIHQAHVAQAVGKTPSAWGKIEGGQSPLLMDSFFGACVALSLHPTHIMGLVERLIPIFNRHEWYFQSTYLGDEDELLPLVQGYFASAGYEALKSRPFERMSIQAFGGVFSSAVEPTAVQYCCVQAVKEWLDDGARMGSNPQLAPMPTLGLATTAFAGKHRV